MVGGWRRGRGRGRVKYGCGVRVRCRPPREARLLCGQSCQRSSSSVPEFLLEKDTGIPTGREGGREGGEGRGGEGGER